MTPAALRKLCLGFPGAREEFPFGEDSSVFKVAGKMFALSPLKAKPLRISLKCEPDLAVRLRAEHPEIIPGHHLDKRHWNTVHLDGPLTGAFVRELVEDSYDLVVAGLPKREQEKLGWVALSRE
ncbi:MmcQ/YjbR family DNA-binding protein [Amycolatopsis sp. QT-25]|uniref:MmcQ/YjbR family DNA-binding protein n=1 Tax=Amycolatopsis sp. QT-25 TaxID=3034022 RepID=UPI0023EAF1E5|nr:MmcQ/YjbR family DNA-binding protein [Amycolatopsis sp. QT-25]WET77068.1 MmcQ/YjbR family DNA-binding protein [Amycolatopsis sp. QT-25]